MACATFLCCACRSSVRTAADASRSKTSRRASEGDVAVNIQITFRGMRRGCAGDSEGMRSAFGGCAPKLWPKGMGFGGLETSPLTPFIILKGVEGGGGPNQAI